MTSMGNQTRMTRIVSQRCAYYATAAKIVEDQKLLTIIAKLCILDNCGRCDDFFFFFQKIRIMLSLCKYCCGKTVCHWNTILVSAFYIYWIFSLYFFTFQTNVFMHQSSNSYSSKTAPAQLYWVRSN